MPRMVANALLRSLPPAESERLERYFKIVPLVVGQRLSTVEEPMDHVYFPLEGAVSRLVQLASAEAIEVGIVGCDGMIGVPLVLGGSAGIGLNRVQIAGSAAVMSAADFQEHVSGPKSPLMNVLMIYANLQLQVVTQLAACHSLHRVEQRLSRCILSLLDYNTNKNGLSVTHDTLAEFLGVHRPSVSYALAGLATTGAIGSERRRIIVRDRAALQEHACECYALLRDISARELRNIRHLFRA